MITTPTSPRLKARIAGLTYLIIFIAGPFGQIFVRDRLIVYRDAGATAANILAHESLYRLGGVAALLTVVCEPILALLFYELLKPAGRTIALLAAFFRLVYAAINGTNQLLLFAPLVLLRMEGTDPRWLALACLRIYEQGLWITLIFFGLHCLLLGYLIMKSTFLPRILGALLAVAGVCYLFHSFARLQSPAFGERLFPYLILPGFVAELLLTLWLIAVGLNVQRWEQQATAAP